MSKVSDAVINALKAKFETGDIPDGPDFSEFLDAVQEAAQDHEHNAEGGSGSGTGDASKVAWSTGLSGIPGAFPPSEHNHDDRYFTEDEHIATSTGAPDAGKPIKLNAGGKVDPTMVNGGGGGKTFPTYIVAAVDSVDTERADYVCEGVAETVLEDCEDAWDEATGTGVTSEADTVDKQVGTASAKMTLASGLEPDALIACEVIAPTDIPKGAMLILWFKSNDWEMGSPEICLSDAVDLGNVVFSANLEFEYSGSWIRVSVGPISSALEGVVSVGLRAGENGCGPGLVFHVDDLRFYTADEVVINEALEDLPDDGGCVALLEGNYVIAGPVKVPSYCSLVGGGMGTVLKKMSGLNPPSRVSPDNTGIIENLDQSGGNTEITISSMTLHGNKDNTTKWHEGVEFVKVTHSVVSHLFIRDWRDFGIKLELGSYNNVYHNHLYNGYIGLRTVNEEATVINANIVEICQMGMYGGGTNLVITGNLFRLVQQNGVYLCGCNHCVFSGNHISEASQVTDNSWSLLAIQDCDYNLIANNVLRMGDLANQAKYGIRVIDAGSAYNMIHGNDLYASAETTDLIDGGTGTQKRDNRNNAGDGWIADV